MAVLSTDLLMTRPGHSDAQEGLTRRSLLSVSALFLRLPCMPQTGRTQISLASQIKPLLTHVTLRLHPKMVQGDCPQALLFP